MTKVATSMERVNVWSKLIYGFVIHKRYKNVPTYDPNKLITKIRLQVNDSFLEIKQQKF